LEGKAYNSLSNKQLLCMVCNREKAAMTIEQIAKHQGLTMEEILAIPHADHP
jgi:predicted transcriptional regulator